jgi:hypothetical protein
LVNFNPEIFPVEKTNLPAKDSRGLNNFILGIKIELKGIKYNPTKEEKRT